MIRGFRAWLNSMQAHMIGFALGVIVVITALSISLITIAGPPQRSPMTIYDLSRVIRGLEPARTGLAQEFTRTKASHAREPASEVERQLSGFLARELKVPAADVRLYLGNRAPSHLAYVARQAALYAQDGGSSPIVQGTLIAAVRQADGTWNLYVRRSKAGFENYWQLLRASPWLGFLIVVPLSMWFSTLIARPVRAFAAAASQAGDGRREFPVPVEGPTEIRVAARALNEMQARIRDFVRERTALVGAIAHDLRTPLNNLRFRIAGAPDEVRIPAEADIRQLELLINSTLDYVESDGRILTIDPIDLGSLLESIVDDSRAQGQVAFTAAAPVRIEGDILLLRRLFANLIGNALKYASTVTVALAATPTEAIVEIRDDGPGIPPADLARAFDPFFRGERSRSRTTGGIGLGLAIVRSVAETHGGTVTLENLPAGGLLARVALPLRHAPANEVTAE